MKDILVLPARSEEGIVYARMLALECEDAGLTVALPGEQAASALIDAEAPELDAPPPVAKMIVYGTHPTCPHPGADGYLMRPVEREALLALLDRLGIGKQEEKTEAQSPHIAPRSLHLGNSEKEATFGGQPLDLSKYEYRVLSLLAEKEGQTVTRQMLLDSVWRGKTQDRSNVVESCIKGLRAKLDRRFGMHLILSVRGQGYRLTLPKEEQA